VQGEFDYELDTWDREDDRVKYREARLEPGDTVHVIGGVVEDTSSEWGSGIVGTISGHEDERFLISKGTESEAIKKRLIQFIFGVITSAVLFGIGVSVLQSAGVL